MKAKLKRLPKGIRFVKQDGYRRNGGIAKYCAFDKEGNMAGRGLLYVHNLREARKELLNNINQSI